MDTIARGEVVKPKRMNAQQGLTLGSTRTPPEMPSVLSQLFASSASLSASVQAGPVSLIR